MFELATLMLWYAVGLLAISVPHWAPKKTCSTASSIWSAKPLLQMTHTLDDPECHTSASVHKTAFISRTWRQPNYPKQLAPKRGSHSSFESRPQSHLVSLSGNLSIVQARDTPSRRSYQPIVFARLWWRLWSLQLIRVTLIFKMQKSFIKQINWAHINIFQKKEYWLKIRMEFLRPILAKIELICQQPAMTRPIGVMGVLDRMAGGWRCVLAMCFQCWIQLSTQWRPV